MGVTYDLTGQKFGRLIAIYPIAKRSRWGEVSWRCECDCGVLIDVLSRNLKTGNTKSCGCLKKEWGLYSSQALRGFEAIEPSP